MSVWLILAACRNGDPPVTAPPPVDLVAPVPSGEVRAGTIVDEAALFGGISAEGEAGDFMLVNDRVKFVVQGLRPGSFYVVEGGGVIDADIVRPAGQLGRDAVEEWGTLYGLGRVMIPETVEVVSDGRDGAAIIRAKGYEGPLGLIEGALEAPGFIPNFGLVMTTEFVLRPDTYLLEVRTTASTTTTQAVFGVGDLLMGADEVLSTWVPGAGMGPGDSLPRPWSGYVSERNDVALVLAAPKGEQLSVAGYELLTELASMVVGFGPTVTLPPGESVTWTRYYGVGPDLATLTAEIAEVREEPTAPVAGQVTAADGPVAGARVAIDLDGAPYTLAFTDAEGRFDTVVPSGTVTTLASGRGPSMFLDLPAGAAPGSPYVADQIGEAMRNALVSGAVPVPLAEGRGVATAQAPLVLGVPGTLAVSTPDGLPFTVRVGFTAVDPPTDEARVLPRPSGLVAAGWAADGSVSFPVEPGTYEVLVHRGPRYELHVQTVTVAAGETVAVDAVLPKAFDHTGFVLADPHSHGSPSSDGALPMEDRLLTSAGAGIQVHFGTDHDHLADYRPLLAPLGVANVLRSVVADEVSPPLRGHFNIYPVEPRTDLPNNGAHTWWTDIAQTTDGLIATLREKHGPDFVFQANHPMDNGMGNTAGWQPGRVSRPDYFTDQIQATEILNSGDYLSFLPFWSDLVSRGMNVVPIGVSDSHSHFGGHLGWSATWIEMGTDDPTAFTDAALASTILAGKVQVMRGPFLVTNRTPGTTLSADVALTVDVRAASYVKVDRLRLLRDGVEVQVVEGTSARFTLAPDPETLADAWFAVIAEGDTPMQPLSSDTPWALVGPFKVDVAGDGWTAPLPPLQR